MFIKQKYKVPYLNNDLINNEVFFKHFFNSLNLRSINSKYLFNENSMKKPIFIATKTLYLFPIFYAIKWIQKF
jgi:hypothetical protein